MKFDYYFFFFALFFFVLTGWKHKIHKNEQQKCDHNTLIDEENKQTNKMFRLLQNHSF